MKKICFLLVFVNYRAPKGAREKKIEIKHETFLCALETFVWARKSSTRSQEPFRVSTRMFLVAHRWAHGFLLLQKGGTEVCFDRVFDLTEEQLQTSGPLCGYWWMCTKCKGAGLRVKKEELRLILEELWRRRRLHRRSYFAKGPSYSGLSLIANLLTPSSSVGRRGGRDTKEKRRKVNFSVEQQKLSRARLKFLGERQKPLCVRVCVHVWPTHGFLGSREAASQLKLSPCSAVNFAVTERRGNAFRIYCQLTGRRAADQLDQDEAWVRTSQ